jgi:hypothetical protein
VSPRIDFFPCLLSTYLLRFALEAVMAKRSKKMRGHDSKGKW